MELETRMATNAADARHTRFQFTIALLSLVARQSEQSDSHTPADLCIKGSKSLVGRAVSAVDGEKVASTPRAPSQLSTVIGARPGSPLAAAPPRSSRPQRQDCA